MYFYVEHMYTKTSYGYVEWNYWLLQSKFFSRFPSQKRKTFLIKTSFNACCSQGQHIIFKYHSWDIMIVEILYSKPSKSNIYLSRLFVYVYKMHSNFLSPFTRSHSYPFCRRTSQVNKNLHGIHNTIHQSIIPCENTRTGCVQFLYVSAKNTTEEKRKRLIHKLKRNGKRRKKVTIYHRILPLWLTFCFYYITKKTRRYIHGFCFILHRIQSKRST